jgi:uncharacterized cupin superfamily protein
MHDYPGPFVSHVTTEDWQPDPDVPGSTMHELVHEGGLWAGLTRFDTVDGPICWTPPAREVIHILKGEARIAIADGPTLRLKAGDLASLPAGCDTTWHISTPFKEFWVLTDSSSR